MNHKIQVRLRRIQASAAVVGAVCVIAACAAAWKDTRTFFESYIFAFLFWIGIPIGSGLVLVFANLTSAEWVGPVRPPLESASRSFFVNLLLGIPLLAGARQIYSWANGNNSGFPAYLNMPFWVARTVVLLCLWSLLLNRLTSRDPITRVRWSAAAAVVLPITAAFAYVDWFMSIQTNWRSTAFGITVLAAQILAALSVVVLIIPLLYGEVSAEFRVDRLHQLGNLLLTFVMFWAYLAFSEFLIIYSANLPHEIGWYQRRTQGAWLVITVVVAIAQFFLPFMALLFRRVKRSIKSLSLIACGILISNALYCYWLTAPSFGISGKQASWLDPVLFLAIGAIYVVVFIGDLRRAAPTLPWAAFRTKLRVYMQRDDQNRPEHHERFKPPFGGVIAVLVFVCIAALISHAALWDWWNHLRTPSRLDSMTVWNPAGQAGTVPLLQTNPATDFAFYTAQQSNRLHDFAWVDQSKKIARVPIEVAMDVILSNGLPQWSTNSEVSPLELQWRRAARKGGEK